MGCCFCCIKHNLFCFMDCVSKPFFKKVCKDNNSNISLPHSQNGKIDVFIMNHISFLDLFIAYYSAHEHKSAFVGGHALKNISGLEIYNNTVFEVKKGVTKEDVCSQFIDFMEKYESLEIIGLAPEGNILTRENYDKSVTYCTKNEIPVFKNVLYPRFVAFNGIVSALRKTNKLGKIYVTTAFLTDEKEIPTDRDTDSLFGKFSLLSLFVFRKIPKIYWKTVETEIKDDENIDEWLLKQFRIIDENIEQLQKQINV